MIKLFSLIFYLCSRTRGDDYVVNPTSPSKSKAQTQFEIKNYNNELMSHLLCLNSCDNYPNKCPHICLHLLVKQHLLPPGRRYTARQAPSAEAYYTDRHRQGNNKFEILAALQPSSPTPHLNPKLLKLLGFLGA